MANSSLSILKTLPLNDSPKKLCVDKLDPSERSFENAIWMDVSNNPNKNMLAKISLKNGTESCYYPLIFQKLKKPS